MTSILYKLFSDLGFGGWAIVIVLISFFIDLTPGIKFNPITFIIKKMGDAFNHSVDSKLDVFETKINEKINLLEEQLKQLSEENNKQNELIINQGKSIDIAEVNRLKMEILDFSNRLSNKQKFTTEQYRTIMDCYTRYEHIIGLHEELSNGKINVEYDAIVLHYTTHKDDGEFMF